MYSRQRYNRNYAGPWRKTPGRIIGLLLIRFYQLTFSSFVGNHCRHMPSCSEYGYEAIARFGLWNGGWMTLFRIMRCGPFGSHGIDRVPVALNPYYKAYFPWRFWKIASTSNKNTDCGKEQ